MLLTNISYFQIAHTAGTNLTVADMLSPDFSQKQIKYVNYSKKPFLLILTLFNSNPIFLQKEIHYLVKLEDVLATQKK